MIRLLLATDLENCAWMTFEAWTDSRLLPEADPCESERTFPSLTTAGMRATRAIIQKTTTILCLLTTVSPSREKTVPRDRLLFGLLGASSLVRRWTQPSPCTAALWAGS